VQEWSQTLGSDTPIEFWSRKKPENEEIAGAPLSHGIIPFQSSAPKGSQGDQFEKDLRFKDKSDLREFYGCFDHFNVVSSHYRSQV
jgi:hypothetical protein